MGWVLTYLRALRRRGLELPLQLRVAVVRQRRDDAPHGVGTLTEVGPHGIGHSVQKHTLHEHTNTYVHTHTNTYAHMHTHTCTRKHARTHAPKYVHTLIRK